MHSPACATCLGRESGRGGSPRNCIDSRVRSCSDSPRDSTLRRSSNHRHDRLDPSRYGDLRGSRLATCHSILDHTSLNTIPTRCHACRTIPMHSTSSGSRRGSLNPNFCHTNRHRLDCNRHPFRSLCSYRCSSSSSSPPGKHIPTALP